MERVPSKAVQTPLSRLTEEQTPSRKGNTAFGRTVSSVSVTDADRQSLVSGPEKEPVGSRQGLTQENIALKKKQCALVENVEGMRHMPYASLSTQLFVNGVVSASEKSQLSGNPVKAWDFLSGVLNDSLAAGSTKKYDGFLRSLKKSEDTLHKQIAERIEQAEQKACISPSPDDVTFHQRDVHKNPEHACINRSSAGGAARLPEVELSPATQSKLDVLTQSTARLTPLLSNVSPSELWSHGVISRTEHDQYTYRPNAALSVIASVARQLAVGNDACYDNLMDVLADHEDISLQGVARDIRRQEQELSSKPRPPVTSSTKINSQVAAEVMTEQYQAMIHLHYKQALLITHRLLTWTDLETVSDFSDRKLSEYLLDKIIKALEIGDTSLFTRFLAYLEQSDDALDQEKAQQIRGLIASQV